MAAFTTLLYTLFITISTISAQNDDGNDTETGIRTALFMKSRISEYATPIGKCYSRNINGHGRSMRLHCEERCYFLEDGTEECDRDVVAYKWVGEVCDENGANAFSTNRFEHKDKAGYPYNCFQDREREGYEVKEEDYVTPYMNVRLEYGLLLEDFNKTYNYTNENNETVTDWSLRDHCIKKPNQTFYRSFLAIVDKCFLAWKGARNPKWFKARCNEDGFVLHKYDAYGCTNDSEVFSDKWPWYQPNGCQPQTWLDKYWYTEVTTCTHPSLINFAKACHYYGQINISLSFIIFMVIYMIIN